MNENLTPTVQALADGKMSRLTLMLWAKDEDDPRAWKRFDDNAELKVTYVPRPGVPTDVGLIPGDGKTAYCRTNASDPLIVTRLDPMVQARVQTQVEPKKGEEKGSLQAGFRAARKLTDGTWEEIWTDEGPPDGYDPDNTLEKLRMTNRTDGTEYRYRARTQSRWSSGGKSGELASSLSPWCYFKIDSTAPKVPQITANGPYTECVTDVCEGAGGPGIPGSFTFKPNAADGDIVGYRWKLLTSAGAKEVSGETYTEKAVIPSLTGTQVLSVEAKDVRKRFGPPAEFTFKVSPAEGATGRWHFDDGAPGSEITVAKDTATVGTRHDATLYTAGAGWSTMARRGDTDQSLWLDSATPANQTAYAATSAAAVNTKDSFTLSTWVYLTDASSSRMVLTTPGDQAQAFALYYSSSSRGWVFSHTLADSKTPVFVKSEAEKTDPVLNVWTHLAAVFDTHADTDPANDTIQLYVNGRPQGTAAKLAASAASQNATYQPWTAAGGLQFGRSFIREASGQYFRGRIDESAVWQRPLTEEEIRQEVRLEQDGLPANELVAQWDATTATGTEIGEGTPYPNPSMKLSATGAVLDDAGNGLILDGTAGYASAQGPVVDESGSFTVSARVQLNAQALAGKSVGYKAQVAGQRSGGESSWALWVVKPAEGFYQWQFTRTATDVAGKVTRNSTVTPRADLAETDTWVDVTGVFDAQEAWDWADPVDPAQTEDGLGKMHLYVGSADKPSRTSPGFDVVQQGSGELAMGRGTTAGTTGHYLPGRLDQLRVWTGAMTRDQISGQVLAASDDVG